MLVIRSCAVVIALCCCSLAVASPVDLQGQILHRQRREAVHYVDDCLVVTSKEGTFHYKSTGDMGITCGLYFITDPERQVEIRLEALDIDCHLGLMAVVDGWELNGEYFPAPEDHALPLESRVVSACPALGEHPVQRHFVSSQNAALVQYKVPEPGQGFTLHVRYIRNPKPCNILVEGTADVYTLNNQGRAVNCSVTALYPAVVELQSVQVGVASLHAPWAPSTLKHHCDEHGNADFLAIGGSLGLDTSRMLTEDAVCGAANPLKHVGWTVGCGITTVRLVSSGHYRNVATIALRPAEEEDLMEATPLCIHSTVQPNPLKENEN